MKMTHCPDDNCNLPAEVVDEFVLESTSGPVNHQITMCVARHKFYHVTD